MPHKMAKKAMVSEVQEEIADETYLNQQQIKEDYIDKHIEKIRQLIKDNLYYPRSARRRRIVGDVVVRFNISKNGETFDIKVLSSSHDILSRAAVKTIENLSGSFPKPKENLVLKIPINYKLF